MQLSNDSLSQILAAAKPQKLAERYQKRRSAVAMVMDQDDLANASLLLIQRAKHESDPWSGHMAFPGGRHEDYDRNGLATAKREMHEEVGFDIDQLEGAHTPGQVIGRLSDFSTRQRAIPIDMVVSPYVFLVEKRPHLTINYEVADTVWIPLSYFADLRNRSSLQYSVAGKTVSLPCFRYSEEKVVWGMTLKMIDELLLIAGVDIPADRVSL
ncbi:CoA pyrophosphatase [Pseudomonadales bacterium]|nr:CoA pyrophosphatase [Pseudomonadales bacterium]